MNNAKKGSVISLNTNKKRNISSKDNSAKKKMSPFLASFTTAVIFLLLTTVLTALIYFNIGDLGIELVRLLRTNDSTYVAEQAEIKGIKINLSKKEEELMLLEKDLKKKEIELIRSEENLMDSEISLQEKHDNADQILETLSADIKDVQDLVSIYKAMEPEVAADIMMRQENEEMIMKILKSMKSNMAASVLSNMNPDKAADLLAKMSGKEDKE